MTIKNTIKNTSISIVTILGTIITTQYDVDAFTIRTFFPTYFSDEVAGISGFEIEDFEDTTLISGLTIEWDSPDLGPINTLPTLYNPKSQGFNNNAWDGEYTLNNTQQQPYSSISISQTTTFRFANHQQSVGLGISNLQFAGAKLLINEELEIDFSQFGNFGSLPLFSRDNKNVYIRIDADANESLHSIGIRGRGDDFLTFDRLALSNSQPVPEPLTILGSATAIAFGATFKRKLKKANKK